MNGDGPKYGSVAMTRQTEIPAINVLLACAELRDRDQVFFNGKLNEFMFASRSSKREFIEQWQRALDATGAMPTSPDPHE